MSNTSNLSFRKLTPQDLGSILSLQQTIINNLKPEETEFIAHRSRADFEKLLTPPSGIYGFFDGDKLVAQMACELPQPGMERGISEFKQQTPNENLVLFEAIFVDPKYRGHGLMHQMLDRIEHTIHEEDPGRICSIIKIAYDNPASWVSAMRHGMIISKIGIDPDDDGKVFYLEKTVNTFPLLDNTRGHKSVALKTMLAHPGVLYTKIEHLLSHGYIGARFDKLAKTLTFVPVSTSLTRQVSVGPGLVSPPIVPQSRG